MAGTSRSYEGHYKAWLLATAPASWATEQEGDRTLTAAELTAGTRLVNLISDGGVTMTGSSASASQALLDEGKVSHSAGTREYSGGRIIHERRFPVSEDDMWNLYEYGDQRYLVIAPDARSGTPGDGEDLHVFQVEVGEVEIFGPSRDTKQNFQVPLFVQDWDLRVAYEAA